MRAFTGSELNRHQIPSWVEDIVMRGKCAFATTVQKKMGFTVEPDVAGASTGIKLPRKAPERLTAPVCHCLSAFVANHAQSNLMTDVGSTL